MQEEPNKYVKELTQEKYKYGFTTEVHTDIIERGLNEDVIRLISAKKNEPEWLLEFRLKAYRHWLTLEMPTWAHLVSLKLTIRRFLIMPIRRRRKKDRRAWRKSIPN